MSINQRTRNHTPGLASIATLDLVALALEGLTNRHTNLDGMAVLHGPPGRGKSMAAGAMVSEYRAYYVQIRRIWTIKTILQKILLEMGVAEPKHATIPVLEDLVTTQLARSNRPLILDEANYLVRTDSLIESIRDIHMASRAPVLLVGTDELPIALRRWDQTHSRCRWIAAPKATLDDARKLATIYAHGITIADDLLEEILDRTDGSVRYICLNQDRIKNEALINRINHVTLAIWDELRLGLYTDHSEGEPE